MIWFLLRIIWKTLFFRFLVPFSKYQINFISGTLRTASMTEALPNIEIEHLKEFLTLSKCLTFKLLGANYITKWGKIPWKMTETLPHGYSSELSARANWWIPTWQGLDVFKDLCRRSSLIIERVKQKSQGRLLSQAVLACC